MILVKKLSFNHVRPIFDEISFVIGENQKVGLTGPNGAGKSTLFKLIAGLEQLQSGSIDVQGNLAYVPQEVKRDIVLENANSIKEYLDPNDSLQEFELEEMIRRIGMDISLPTKPLSLSGGQKTKLAILRAIISQADILLLDEPTNFLDTAGKYWVMNLLSTYPKTFVMVSHDLDLLDNAIDKVLAINPHTQKVEEYKGTYTQYLKLKKQHDDHLKRQIINEQKHIKRMEESLSKLYKRTSDKGVRQRVMLERRIERMKDTLPDLPPDIKFIVKLPTPSWTGELPIRAVSLSKSYDGKSILDDASLSIKRGERVALIGPNGVGKSTFIKMLMGKLAPDSGEVIKTPELSIGYYSQEFETFDLSKTLVQTVEENTQMDFNKIRPFLASFLFKGEMVFQNIASLSGGEKTRLSIALLLLHSHNLLILDEPTTYLDVLSQRIILEALKQYEGSMLVVSHTEDFIKELKPNRALLLPDNIVTYWKDELLERVSEI